MYKLDIPLDKKEAEAIKRRQVCIKIYGLLKILCQKKLLENNFEKINENFLRKMKMTERSEFSMRAHV